MIMKIILLTLLNLLIVASVKIKKVSPIEKTSSYWIQNGKEQIYSKLHQKPIESKAKNIILSIGDGMGISTVTSARIYKNQRMTNSEIPDENLFFENFPNVGLSKTYSVDRYVSDSAATATAILTGIKINNGVIGLSSKVLHNDCDSYTMKQDELTNIAEMFFKIGKSVGFVTTTAIVDATPAAMYASTPSRTWKYKVKRGCLVKDIASQLIDKAEIFQVVMGGGRKYFLPKHERDPQYQNMKGVRNDNRNLIVEWNKKVTERKKGKARFIWNSTQFTNLDTMSINYLLGLFEYDNMKYHDERVDHPTLEEMTKKAIDILSRNPKGYFLLIEGGKIDKAHHANQAMRAILETLEFEKAIKIAAKLSDPMDTLMIVTADHSHTFTLGSYLKREVDITGLNKGYEGIAIDKKGHTSLLYGNGPGYKSPRINITSKTIFNPKTKYNSGVPLYVGSHGGEDVSVYARGPWAHLLKDVYDQSYIGNVMMYASCNGQFDNRKDCNSSISLIYQPIILLFAFILNRYYSIF